jgi:hypothetical protein
MFGAADGTGGATACERTAIPIDANLAERSNASGRSPRNGLNENTAIRARIRKEDKRNAFL